MLRPVGSRGPVNLGVRRVRTSSPANRQSPTVGHAPGWPSSDERPVVAVSADTSRRRQKKMACRCGIHSKGCSTAKKVAGKVSTTDVFGKTGTAATFGALNPAGSARTFRSSSQATGKTTLTRRCLLPSGSGSQGRGLSRRVETGPRRTSGCTGAAHTMLVESSQWVRAAR